MVGVEVKEKVLKIWVERDGAREMGKERRMGNRGEIEIGERGRWGERKGESEIRLDDWEGDGRVRVFRFYMGKGGRSERRWIRVFIFYFFK